VAFEVPESVVVAVAILAPPHLLETGAAQASAEILLVEDVAVSPEAQSVVERLARPVVGLARNRCRVAGVIVARDNRVAVLVDRDQLLEVGGGEPDDAPGTQDPVDLTQEPVDRAVGDVLDLCSL